MKRSKHQSETIICSFPSTFFKATNLVYGPDGQPGTRRWGWRSWCRPCKSCRWRAAAGACRTRGRGRWRRSRAWRRCRRSRRRKFCRLRWCKRSRNRRQTASHFWKLTLTEHGVGIVLHYQACTLKLRLRELTSVLFHCWVLNQLSALRVAWLFWMQQKQEMSSINLNLILHAWIIAGGWSQR